MALFVVAGYLSPNGAVLSAVRCDERPIRLAFYQFGYFYFDQGRDIDKDIVDELMRQSGCRFETQVMARAHIWADLANGSLDMSVSGIQNAERGTILPGLLTS